MTMSRRAARRYRRKMRRLMRRAVTLAAGVFTSPHGSITIHEIPRKK